MTTEVAVASVLVWAERHGRDLPWRDTRDPWAVLVSEVMLQQTQAERVVPAWHAFLDRWPTPAALAAAPTSALLEQWTTARLGYPRRALRLHAAAQRIVADHGGVLPARLADLLALPGVGAYTARAVLVFAFEHDRGVVDTNVARVLTRWSGARHGARDLQHLADQLVPVGEAWAWNQALFDLGAARCRPDPRCDGCPLSAACTWHAAGHPEPDPAVGSAGVSRRQAAFAGSDRQARGRLLAALVDGPVASADAPSVMGLGDDPDRARRLLAGLRRDGLISADGETYALGGASNGPEIS